MYSVTNSKELVTMNKKWEGCGSSRIISNLLCSPVLPLDCPKKDQFITIDRKLIYILVELPKDLKFLVYALPCVILLPNQKWFYNMTISFNISNWHRQYSKTELNEKN